MPDPLAKPSSVSGAGRPPGAVARQWRAPLAGYAQAARATFAALPPYPAASIAALLGLGIADMVQGKPHPDASAVLFWVCIAAAFGAIHGSLWQLAFAALRPASRPLQIAAWVLASVAGGAWLAGALGAFDRLHTRHHDLAMTAVLASMLGAAVLGAFVCLFQPGRRRLDAPVFALGPRLRLALALLCLGAAGALFHADGIYYEGLYPRAHQALRAASLAFAMFGLALCAGWLRMPKLTRGWVAALCALALAPTLLPNSFQTRAGFALNAHPWAADVMSVAQYLLDADRDGYSALLGGGDCNDFDAGIHPAAREIVGNGVDDNCVLGDAVMKPTSLDFIREASSPATRDVVLITLDTLRPDHLGVYSRKYGPRGRNTSPNLDRWAKDAYVFRNAFTAGGWTVIALASLMRGLNPRRLDWTLYQETSQLRLMPEVRVAHDLQPGEAPMAAYLMPAKDRHVTLATLLKRRGMRTLAVADDGYSAMLQPGIGLDVGFEEYVQVPTTRKPPDQYAVDRALRALRRVRADQRFFMWVHLFGPHSPNEVRPDVPLYGPSIADGYDHEIRFMDLHLGRLLDALSQRTPAPIVIVTGDHGEVVTEHNRWHGFSLNEETMRVPLLIKLPGAAGGRIDPTVSLVDLFPTVLALTNTPGPRDIDGVDLGPIIAGAEQPVRLAISDCWRYGPGRRVEMDSVAVTDGSRFVYYDRLTGVVWSVGAGGRNARHLIGPALHADPLARFALGYLEDVAPLPR